MELSERIKKARKEAGYKSRDALADFLGSTRNALNEYEQGRVVPNDVFLQLMATKLHISYDWLKFGKGVMKDTDADSLAALLDDNSLSDDDKEIIRIYISLPPEHRQILKDFAVKVANAEKAAKQIAEEDAPIVEEEKPDALSDEEWEMVKKHRYEKKVKIKGGINNNSGTINF